MSQTTFLVNQSPAGYMYRLESLLIIVPAIYIHISYSQKKKQKKNWPLHIFYAGGLLKSVLSHATFLIP